MEVAGLSAWVPVRHLEALLLEQAAHALVQGPAPHAGPDGSKTCLERLQHEAVRARQSLRRLADAERPRAIGEEKAPREQIDDQGFAGPQHPVGRTGAVAGGALLRRSDNRVLGLLQSVTGEHLCRERLDPGHGDTFFVQPEFPTPPNRALGQHPRHRFECLHRGAGGGGDSLDLAPGLSPPQRQHQRPARDRLPASLFERPGQGQGGPGRRPSGEDDPAGADPGALEGGVHRRREDLLAALAVLAQRLHVEVGRVQQFDALRLRPGGLFPLHRREVREAGAAAMRHHAGVSQPGGSDKRRQVRVTARAGQDHERLGILLGKKRPQVLAARPGHPTEARFRIRRDRSGRPRTASSARRRSCGPGSRRP